MVATTSARFQIGERVSVDLFGGQQEGFITEYRGPLAGQGLDLYEVELLGEDDETFQTEVPVASLTRIEAERNPHCPSPDDIAAFLREDGLRDLLQHQSSSGRLWLRLDGLGNVTSTSDDRFRGVGGTEPPRHALHRGRIVPEREQDVVQFVQSFGITPDDAIEIVGRLR